MVPLRFQKFMLKFTTELFRFVMSLFRCKRLVTEAFTFTIELLTLVKAVLKEALSVKSEPTVLETLHNDELITATEPKRLALF